jgi:hypothetical protein
MHPNSVLACFLAVVPHLGQALTIDRKALARFDINYADCESRLPRMRGYRDEAFLSLWAVKVDQDVRTQLASVRKSATYLSERQRVLQAAAARASNTGSADSLEQECQALWAQVQRAIEVKP